MLALVGLVVGALIVWGVVAHSRRRRALKASLEQLGFQPCPEQRTWLEETITRLHNNRDYRYEVRDPRRLPGEPAVYYYVKICHGSGPRDNAMTEEEVLFPLKRSSTAGLVVFVKPSSLASGFGTRMVSAVATGPWDTQPDDLERIELPQDLKDTNLLAAMGPPGSNLYDLVDSRILTVVQGLGDAGGLSVQFRDAWCTVNSTGEQLPFRLDELIGRIRPLL